MSNISMENQSFQPARANRHYSPIAIIASFTVLVALIVLVAVAAPSATAILAASANQQEPLFP